MRITVLIEDKEHSSLSYEHGLSFFIEYHDDRYLLDAGSTSLFIHNAKALNIPLNDIKACFLSHGHYDHAGGFKDLIELYNDIQIYAMESALLPNYSISHGHFHEVSIPADVLKYKDHFKTINKPLQLYKGVYLIPHNQSYEHIGQKCGMYKNEYEYDDFSHELSLVFETDQGLVIFNSCSHAGLANIVEEVKEYIPDTSIYAYIGGLHLIGESENLGDCAYSREELKEIADYIIKEDIQIIYTGHCTGKSGYEVLEEYLADRILPLYVGLEIEI